MSSPKLPDDLLEIAIFRTITLAVTVKNKTTMKDINGTPEIPVRVEEIIENGIVISAPGPSFARDHKVIVQLWPEGTNIKDPPRCNATGKIVRLETFSDGSEKAVIGFTHVDKETWDAVWKVFDQRQDEINKFIEQVKG